MTPLRRDDLKLLRGTIAASTLMLGLAVGGFWDAATRYRDHGDAQAGAVRADAQARSVRAELLAQREQVRSFRDRFSVLELTGVVGEFHKTAAVDRFEALARHGAGAVRGYRLEGRVSAGELVQASGLRTLELVRQGMSFEAEPLHEEEFLRATARIGDGLGGLATIESCELGRGSADAPAAAAGGGAGAADSGAASVARLSAKCRLAWYSFVAAQQASGAAPPAGPGLPPAVGVRQ